MSRPRCGLPAAAAALCALLAAPEPSRAAEPVEPWAPSELVWPWQELGRLWESQAAGRGRAGDEAWPKTVGGICRDPSLPGLHDACRGKTRPRPAALTVDLGAYPSGKRHPMGRPFESFTPGGDWRSETVDAEMARAWAEMPPLAKVELGYPLSPRTFVHFRLGLRRDLAAWHEDPAGLNLPLTGDEVDVNEPSLGYFHADGGPLTFTVGRFPVHWSPSPDYGVTLTRSVPYHNGAEMGLKAARVRYRFLVSSLNPWLEGTPAGDGSGEDYPVGSEEWRQRHYPDEGNAVKAHKRVYDARIKTLFAHRLEAGLGPFTGGLTEIQIVGGKVPDLRDANPFAFFHNDFKDGYVNSGISFDGLLRLPFGAALAAEIFLDDARYSGTEREGTPSLRGYLLELRHAFAARGWAVLWSLDYIRTDPFLYGYLQPLNTLASRQVLTSNHDGPGGGSLVDKLVVDHPVGYARGGDAMDFRWRLEARRGALALLLSADNLSRGEVDLRTPFAARDEGVGDSPSGLAESELRLRAAAAWRWRGASVKGGLDWRRFENAGHAPGEGPDRLGADLGISWTLPH